MKNHIPNVLTSLNLFSGTVAAVMVFRNHADYAAYLVILAAIFDLLDGMVARRVAGNSAFGKELDSLADMVSFGFVPGAVMFKLFQSSGMEGELFRYLQFFPFIITVFSALRLAKFNTDTRQTNSFIGLPTPANTLLIISLPMILHHFPGRFDSIILQPVFIILFSMLSSYLLVAEIPLFSLKFKSFRFTDNKFQYLLIVLALLLLPLLSFAAIPLLIFLYIILSVIQNQTEKKII